MPGVYTQQANPAFEAELALRTAERDAVFFIPHLRPGMSVLDAGCGPGTITLGLAERVAADGADGRVVGSVVGVDIQAPLIERARALSTARGQHHVRFEVADLHRLPFADGSFDAVFGNGVLMHLADPARALAELRRVLRPGGVIGIRDADFGAVLYAPVTPALERWLDLRVRVRQHNGGDPFLGRHHRRLLIEAGFVGVEAGASVDSAGTPETVKRHAAFLEAQLVGLARTALAQGWMDQAMMNAARAAIGTWMRHAGAFAATTWCETVGRVGE